jgi:hypothetical protein
MLTDGAFYRELGADYYTVRKPAKAKARAVSQLEALSVRTVGADLEVRVAEVVG